MNGLRLPRHRATTANLASIYPFTSGRSLTDRGPLLGVHVNGGGSGWFFDPFELYPSVLTDSNVVIVGRPGRGKSAAVKTLLARELDVYGARRFVAVNDPKGEYGPLAAAYGLTHVRLYPGGAHRLNPLDVVPGDRGAIARERLVEAMIEVALERRLTAGEQALLGAVVTQVAERIEIPVLPDVAAALSETHGFGRGELDHLDERERRELATPLRFALGRLLDRTLRGMFDGPTTVDIDRTNSPGLVVDLSAVFDDREALPLVMMVTGAWLQTMVSGLGDRRGLLVDDEVWALLAHEQTVRHLQARLKLCRHLGIANILVCHKLADLRAQSDDGTAAHKVAAGLLADASTRIVFQQAPDQIDEAQDLLGLNETEAALLPKLVRGRALWRVGEVSAVVQHVIAPHERAFCDTDQAMST